ncbi:MAG: 1-acyl-sn-glycerol-3-phosphate acyltransferase [Deltaproteobacteria bacterium]|nr:1-acyl-sn-glycerol-3-phosphate acyltransferase [Deltaproteobacteria bacterium]
MEINWKNFLDAPLFALIKRLDFVSIVDHLSRLEPGISYINRPDKLGPAFSDQEQIAKLAVDLTERAFQEKGDYISRQEIESHISLIGCRYDSHLHDKAKSACFNLVNHLFVSQEPNHLLTSADLRELRNINPLLSAQKEGLGVVYLINHSSHFDEFIFNIFLDQNGLNMPLFAAGQNMMLTPSLATLFMLGSYVIVRKGASRSYLSSLFHYCQALAEMGKPQGIFLEAWSGGARTRDGSLRYPRRLVTIQGALAARGDVFIQPVVISYSRVPEDRGLSEGRGLSSWVTGSYMLKSLAAKPWRPLYSLAQGLKGLYGRAYVGFGRGRLLSELKNEWEQTPKELALDEFTALYAIKEIAKDKKIMATQLAALALNKVRHLGRRLSDDKILPQNADLTQTALKALKTIEAYHQRVFETEPDLEDILRNQSLDEALKDGLESLALRSVITDTGPKWLKKPKIKSVHALSYYATHSDRRLYSPSAKENLVVCGAGLWGFSLVTLVGRRTLNDKRFHNSSLSLYDPREEAVQSLAYNRALDSFSDFRLPKNVFPTYDHVEAFRKSTEVIVATPPETSGELLKTILTSSERLRTLIVASRGFDRLSHRLTIQMAWEAAVAAGRTDINILALCGPVEPLSLLSGQGGSFILAGPVKDGRLSVASLFRYGSFKVNISDDPIGAQTAAALIDAFSLYGLVLFHRKELRTPKEKAEFIREISFEAKTLAMALGGQPSTFEADNPAWVSELITTVLTPSNLYTMKLAAVKGPEALKDYLAEKPLTELWPDRGAEGYYSIHSAFLLAKHLSLTLKHLERANQIFWG